MIDLFKKDVNIGDKVKLILTTGKESIGTVLEIGSNHILLKNEEGNTTRIFEVLIGGWDIINIDTVIEQDRNSSNQEDKNIQIEDKLIIPENTSKVESDTTDTIVKLENDKEINKTIENDSIIEKKKTQIKKIEGIGKTDENKINISVVGKISLDKIDTKKNRFPSGRTYRLRQVSKIFDIPIDFIVKTLKEKGISIDDNNSNYKIDQIAYNIVDAEKENYKKAKTSKKNTGIKEMDDIGFRFNSLSDLSKLKEKIEIDISKQLLPANARIKRYFPQKERLYGFLTDNDGADYYFKYSMIQDESLYEKLQDFGSEGIQIICQLNNFNGKLVATNLYLPQSVNYFYEKSEKCFKDGNARESLQLLNIVLLNFPDYTKALDLKKKIEYYNKRIKKGKYVEKSLYPSAKYEYKKGNTDLAKKQFLQSIEKNNQYSEKAIKELAYLLSGEGKYDEAIALVVKHSSKIKSSDPNSFIAYFYEAKKDYNNAIIYLQKIKTKSQPDKLKLSKRLALCYVGIGDYENAETQINLVLKIRPNDTVTNKLKEVLLIAKAQGSEEEIESIFKEAEISALTGGLSKYIIHTLEHCEYSGVPASEIAKGSFNKKTLENLKEYIQTIKDGRPRERAEAYLSQAKIEQILDSENTKVINGALAKYSASIAISWASDGRQVDTLRYFILETAILETDYFILQRYIPIYLHSYFLSSLESKSKIRQKMPDLFKQIFKDKPPKLFWFGVLDLLLVNSKFSTQFLSRLFKEADLKTISLDFLFSFLEKSNNYNLDKNKFLELWKNGREKFKREKDAFNARFNALLQSNTPEALVESFFNIKRDMPEWIGQLDKQRFDSLNDIIETILEFNKQHSFEEKERYFNISISQLTQLKEEIQESPTEISFNSFLSLLNFISNALEDSFVNVIETSKPEINIRIYGEGSINEETGLVNVQFAISNKKGRAPVSYFALNIVNENNITFIEENNIIEQTLKGGDEQILKIKLQIKDDIIEEGATNLKIKYSYKIRGNDKLFNNDDELTLRFYSTSDFIKINNIFSTTADSGPVQDASMFFGRDEFIENIKESIVNSKSKCVIIYGQKRSGKSSVLHHLRERLNNSENTFCISFSLGEIIQDLSPKTFYYTILTELEDSLAILSEQYNNTPNYKAPNYDELDDVPTIIFNDQIKLLKREFNKYSNWSSKKLVLLIDEFTYIYTAIQKDFLSEQFMMTWKSFLEKGFFTSVLIGQDIMPKFKAAYPNEFGVTEDKRLSYLKKSDAINLIEKPIWDTTKNKTRFLGKATDLILDYTSSNPYYVQIFCARLVDYMNEHKAMSVTEADVHDVAESFIKGEQALTADKFDNLITAGDADLDAFDSNDVLSALKAIAIASKNLDSCPREAISLGKVDYEEKILKDLKDREVLSIPQSGYYKINVRLFKEWLLIN